MNEWRPKAWKNPYGESHWNGDGLVSGHEEYAYEAGANAMLEAINRSENEVPNRSIQHDG